MMFKFFFVYCVLVGLITTTTSLSILFLAPAATTSHHIWSMTLVKGLLRRGHHVHVMSVNEAKVDDEISQNLTYTVFENIMKELQESADYNPAEWEKISILYAGLFTYEWGISSCERVTKTKAAEELLEMIKNVEFDVIVQDVTLHECLYGLWEVAKGKPPVVGYIPFGPAPWLKDCIGGSNYPSVRTYIHSDVAKPVGLWQRTWNIIYYIVDDLIRHYYFLPMSQRIAERYIGHKIRPLHEIEKEYINILLINTYAVFEPAIPLPPNAKEVGGMQAQYLQPIAEEKIRQFLDGANNGAVVISLGTNVKWKAIAIDKFKAVITGLSKLKQRVIWKLDIDAAFEIPDNIMLVKWMPQGAILNHKNVKAILTHGGLLSMQEAIWMGVPIIAMPFYMDQRLNAETLVAKGAGIRLDFKTLSEQSVLNAFEEIVYNESYTKNMKQLSNEFRDRPIPPLDLAVWSVEYVARHPHRSLESPIKFQSWIQRNLIDIYATLFLVFITILLVVYFLLKVLFSLYYSRTNTTPKLHKN